MPNPVSLFPKLDEVVSDGGDVGNSIGVYMERQRCELAPISAFGGKADTGNIAIYATTAPFIGEFPGGPRRIFRACGQSPIARNGFSSDIIDHRFAPTI